MVLVLIPLMTNMVLQFSKKKCIGLYQESVQISCGFSIRLPVLSLLICRNLLFILCMRSLSVANTFSYFMVRFYNLLLISFDELKFLILIYFNISFVMSTLYVPFKKSLLKPVEEYILCFLLDQHCLLEI